MNYFEVIQIKYCNFGYHTSADCSLNLYGSGTNQRTNTWLVLLQYQKVGGGEDKEKETCRRRKKMRGGGGGKGGVADKDEEERSTIDGLR